jgi:hypothetical protein
MTQWTTSYQKSINHLSENDKQREIETLKKERDLKDEEIQLLYLENKRLIEMEQSHKKLNGKLREQIKKLEEDAKEILNWE